MNILLLCEGDAETRDSWSGVSYGVVTGLRTLGHEVRIGDCDLYGLRRLFGAGLSVSRDRRRWWVRYHLGAGPFWLRSRVASRHVKRNRSWPDVILQFGATFLPSQPLEDKFFLYCDSNIHLSEMASPGGRSEAAKLTGSEIESIRKREAGVYARARTIFTMSRMVADAFEEGFAVPPARLVPVHAGINFSPPAVQEGRDKKRPTVLFVGRDFRRKGGDLLLLAFQALKCRLPDARLVIVGPTQNPAPGVPGIDFLGFLNLENAEGRARLNAAYQEASVFCLPTRFEPLGIVFLEAMAYGVPCVGPDEWAVPEMVEHGKTGLLVSGDDPACWTEALYALLTDRELAGRMGAEGRVRVLEHFTWARVAQDMIRSMR